MVEQTSYTRPVLGSSPSVPTALILPFDERTDFIRRSGYTSATDGSNPSWPTKTHTFEIFGERTDFANSYLPTRPVLEPAPHVPN